MKHIFKVFLLCLVLAGTAGCKNYLDVVPDNVFQFQDLFDSRANALSALATCYKACPWDEPDYYPWTMGDEWIIVCSKTDARTDLLQGYKIMRGDQNKTSPYISFWCGNSYIGDSMYYSIRDCDMFIENIDAVPDMTADEKKDFKSQAIFLKGYYLFWLLKEYGPIVLPKKIDLNASDEEMFLPRSKVDDCFDAIIALMDEAISGLYWRAATNNLGQVDRCAALSIKARVMLYRASPFYNGNTDYANFLDHDGQPFFNQTYDKEKWKDACDAATEAIKACESHGIKLYHYTGMPYDYDAADFEANPERMQVLYDLRFRLCDRWNSEMVWGPTSNNVYSCARCACIKLPEGYGGPGSPFDGLGYSGTSFKTMSNYYSIHGLPLDEDRTVNQNTLLNITTTPDESSPDYTRYRGIMQPGVPTINMYLEREPRFYADLGVTGGYYRAWQVRIKTMMFYGTDGGFIPEVSDLYHNTTGIAIQKPVHPESYDLSSNKMNHLVVAPFPVMRLSDLYLMKAEAMNEYYGPSQEVYDLVDAIRERAGIPTIEESYTNTEWVKDEVVNKHLTQDGLREIIRRERTIELSFEMAHRFWDVRRWKRSQAEFSTPIFGWDYLGSDPSSFFVQTLVQARTWSSTQDLWPIDKAEMERNTNLIQNPGW